MNIGSIFAFLVFYLFYALEQCPDGWIRQKCLAIVRDQPQIPVADKCNNALRLPEKDISVSSSPITRFFGGSPGWVVLRLIFLSVIVGLILSALGIHFDNLFEIVRSLFQRIWDMGYEIIERSMTYFLLGAAVVFPIWLVLRTSKVIRGPQPPRKAHTEDRKTTPVSSE